MALTRTTTHATLTNANTATTTVTATITANSLVIICLVIENDDTNEADAATPMTVSGTAMTWTKLGETSAAPAGGGTRCRSVMYAALSSGAGSRTFTHTKIAASAVYRRMTAVVIEGALSTVATAIPSGNRFVTTSNTANFSRSITPAGTGSMIVGIVGDWAATNTFAALSGNTISSVNQATVATFGFIEPTTQPLTSGSAFTWGANTTSGACTYVVVEVVPAAAGGSPYTLTAAAGTIAEAGTATGLRAARFARAAVGPIALSGTATGLRWARFARAVVGAIALAGPVTVLRAARFMQAAAGAVTLAGPATALMLARFVRTVTGTITVAGTATTLRAARVVGAVQGSVVVTRFMGNLIYSAGAKRLMASLGTMTLAGNAANLIYGVVPRRYVTRAVPGSVYLSGAQVFLGRSGTEQPGIMEFGQKVYLRKW